MSQLSSKTYDVAGAAAVGLMTFIGLSLMTAFRLDELTFHLVNGWKSLTLILAGSAAGAGLGLFVPRAVLPLPLLALLFFASPSSGGQLLKSGHWQPFALSAAVSSAIVLFRRALENRERTGIVKGAMEGVVGAHVTRLLNANPQLLGASDRGASITCMSIDLVGFSTLAAAYPPPVVFSCLRQLHRMISDVVHRHGGLVDRNFRQGFSCFFGHQLLRDGPVGRHTEMAVKCAVEVQRRSIGLILEAVRQKHPVFALRIGIESALAGVGNLGSSASPNLAVVGELVDDAVTFRSVCSMHSIVLSRRAFDLLLETERSGLPFVAKTIALPGKSGMTRVYELDALYDQSGFRETAVDALRKCADLKRLNNRWPIPNPRLIQIATPAGIGILKDISRGGVALAMAAPLPEKKPMQTKVVTMDPLLAPRLKHRNMMELMAEVRWSKKLPDGLLHGLQWLNVDEEAKDFFLQCVLEAQSGYDG